jgi:hypothetical protein
MAAYVLESSALIKRYLRETGTSWLRAITDVHAGHLIYAARVGAVELTATLTRQQRAGNVTAADAALGINQVRHAFAHEFRVVEITATLLSHALNHAQKHGLRAYDAVHLAAATEIHRRRTEAGLPAPTLVCADTELNAAARVEGLLVEDPNTHT